MGGKRRKKVKIIKPKPKLPKTFECPRCGRIAISVEIKDGIAHIRCGNCGLSADIEVPPIFDEVNAYSKFLDLYLDGKLEIKESSKEESINEGEDKQIHTRTQ